MGKLIIKLSKAYLLIYDIFCGNATVWGVWVRYSLTHTIGRLSVHNFYNAFIDHIEMQDYTTIIDKLARYYRRTKLSALEIQEIVECIKSFNSKEKCFEKKYDTLLNKFSKYNEVDLTWEQWCVLSSFVSASGLLRLGQLYRFKAESSILKHKICKRAIEKKFLVYFERSEFHIMKDVYQRLLKNPFVPKSRKNQYKLLIDLLAHNEITEFKKGVFYKKA